MSKSIVVLGASPDRRKFSNKCVRAYLAAGWDVIPVHPTAHEVEGKTAVPKLADLPGQFYDRLSVYLPPAVGAKVIAEPHGKRFGECWLNPGAESSDVIAAAKPSCEKVIEDCSIVEIGFSPSQFPET
jgi:predicted CoA-binding protein